MLITRVELENIKSYRQIAVDFRRGATAISGANGAGKTTILEAIGFALFDYLPYNQGQFVREGEKYGRVVVHLIGSDDRPYVVERRCGSGSRWFIYDQEADDRVEQSTDVLDKLHDLFGIDRERSLSALFRDALGVPQGSFTAIFLETASKRKQTFDTLLQIEDYKTAADYLLEAQKEYKEQALVQQSEIQRLEFETRELEEWRADFSARQQLFQQQTAQMTQWTQQLEGLEERYSILKRQRDELTRLEQEYKQCKTTCEGHRRIMADREQELGLAREAQQKVEGSRSDYQRYQQASELLEQLHRDAEARNGLRQQQAEQANALAKVSTTITYVQKRLEEVALARQRIVELAPLVDEQSELEKQRDELVRKATEYEGLVKEGKRLVQQQAEYLKQQEVIQQNIVEIEPLQPLAARLNERVEALAQLRSQTRERATRNRALTEAHEQLRKKQEERELYAARLRKAENVIAKIEEHRHEAEALPDLQRQYDQLSEQRFRLEGNIESYRKSRKLSVGGQCPFLHEPCINISQRGSSSLEVYFDRLIQEDRVRLEEILEQQNAIAARMTSVKKFADELDKLGQYVVQRDGFAEHLQRMAVDIGRLEREITDQEQILEGLKQLDQQIAHAEAERAESQAADERVRELEGLRMQLQQLQDQARQGDELLQERRRQAMVLRGSEAQLAQVNQQLEQLNDPRGQSRSQRAIVKQEPVYLQQLQEEQQKQQTISQRLQELEQQLEAYAGLDTRIGEQNSILRQSEEGYQTYLGNIQVARLLPQRQQAYQAIMDEVEKAEQALRVAEQTFRQAQAAFRDEDLQTVELEIKRLHGDLKSLGQDIEHNQRRISELEQQIAHAGALLLELEAARKEKQTLEELQAMMEQFRRLIKEAAPHVLKAMLADISAEANRIFGEIMGDRGAQLSWQNDYEIILRRQGVNRTFAQLSGGEQMSAALAVRLALLKKLSTLNLAFFDEPTQNMDELRRMNLAEQIRRVRGFDQLIVISHDDTFEQGLDSLIRLRKVNGETRLVSEEEMVEERERVHAS
ncbi:MAG TPA: SMC family ATPase [Ktedonobacteraceae bacterium]|nr:SMC family ATPase [Ktedonobacteraceae bacterium]